MYIWSALMNNFTMSCGRIVSQVQYFCQGVVLINRLLLNTIGGLVLITYIYTDLKLMHIDQEGLIEPRWSSILSSRDTIQINTTITPNTPFNPQCSLMYLNFKKDTLKSKVKTVYRHVSVFSLLSRRNTSADSPILCENIKIWRHKVLKILYK